MDKGAANAGKTAQPVRVGIVVVSHSRALAAGAAELAREMGVGQVRVEAAGGDVDGGLGASYELIEAAVAAADVGAGVVLLADIGSSVLTARMYAEDANEGGAGGARVVVADAPLVEGAVAAASAAAAGAGLTDVAEVAGRAYRWRKL